jgi:hypothetical protein
LGSGMVLSSLVDYISDFEIAEKEDKVSVKGA